MIAWEKMNLDLFMEMNILGFKLLNQNMFLPFLWKLFTSLLKVYYRPDFNSFCVYVLS